MRIRMELSRILIRETGGMHVVELREMAPSGAEPRILPIMIGRSEAAAVERRLTGQTPARPHTHELLVSVIEATGYRLERVVISDLRQDELGRGTFYARLHLKLEVSGQQVDLDARPSDAIALAVAWEAPIEVEEHVLHRVGAEDGL